MKNDAFLTIAYPTFRRPNRVEKIEQYYSDLPFKADKQSGLRYYFENGFYSYTDGIMLYSMIRHFKPKRVMLIY